jgi:hypothetical protein
MNDFLSRLAALCAVAEVGALPEVLRFQGRVLEQYDQLGDILWVDLYGLLAILRLLQDGDQAAPVGEDLDRMASLDHTAHGNLRKDALDGFRTLSETTRNDDGAILFNASLVSRP